MVCWPIFLSCRALPSSLKANPKITTLRIRRKLRDGERRDGKKPESNLQGDQNAFTHLPCNQRHYLPQWLQVQSTLHIHRLHIHQFNQLCIKNVLERILHALEYVHFSLIIIPNIVTMGTEHLYCLRDCEECSLKFTGHAQVIGTDILGVGFLLCAMHFVGFDKCWGQIIAFPCTLKSTKCVYRVR